MFGKSVLCALLQSSVEQKWGMRLKSVNPPTITAHDFSLTSFSKLKMIGS